MVRCKVVAHISKLKQVRPVERKSKSILSTTPCVLCPGGICSLLRLSSYQRMPSSLLPPGSESLPSSSSKSVAPSQMKASRSPWASSSATVWGSGQRFGERVIVPRQGSRA